MWQAFNLYVTEIYLYVKIKSMKVNWGDDMKRILLLMLIVLTLSGCGSETQDNTSAEPVKVQTSDKKILVVYFSRIGEEYGTNVITRGNTAIVAEIIANKTGADIFEIKAVKPYPEEYEPCVEVAKKELESNSRPNIVGNVENLAQYDTIFVGYPIWLGEMPRIILTFLESNDFNGKKIIPFCTHGGSGLSGTEREIKNACPDATVLKGLSIIGKTAQNNSAAVEKDIDTWLKDLGY